jgi:hypothetical protein
MKFLLAACLLSTLAQGAFANSSGSAVLDELRASTIPLADRLKGCPTDGDAKYRVECYRTVLLATEMPFKKL